MLTAGNIVSSINQLPKNRAYNYLNPSNKGLIEIIDVRLPEGPITISRYNPSKGESPSEGKHATISVEMIWRVANAIQKNVPLNIDRVLGASYNTRSVLESLLAHTPQFYFGFPGRIQLLGSQETLEKGHKHLIWMPEKPHAIGIVEEVESEIVISEIPSREVIYEAVMPSAMHVADQSPIDFELDRRHAQIQLALYMIGQQLGFRTWIAKNDRGIVYNGKTFGQLDNVIQRLSDEKLLQAYSEAVNAASLIDCIWFKNGRLMPAVMEIEHTTGVTSGLARMKHFFDKFPPFPTRYVIVAPDSDRQKVFDECNKPQFYELNTRYFPYSAVEELYDLCKRRNIKGITEEFLDSFMEPTLKRTA